MLGWAMLSATAYPVVVLGGISLPQILPQSDSLHTWLWDAHFYLAFAFFALVLMHVAAALFHAFDPARRRVRNDGVPCRCRPGARSCPPFERIALQITARRLGRLWVIRHSSNSRS